MDPTENQRRLFIELLAELRPWWRRDPGLPRRLAAWLARRRAGSRDRRLYRELTYTALRILPWIESLPPAAAVTLVAAHARRTTDTAAFIDAVAGTAAESGAPAHCDPTELLPDWLASECPAALEPVQRDHLLQRAPLWVRLQAGDAAAVAAELSAAGLPPQPSAHVAGAWRLPIDGAVEATAAYREGRIEIQDVGSQALLTACPGPWTGHWLDACAGAGGKTLQLARLLGPRGRVSAHDIRPAALAELQLRARRARCDNVGVDSAPSGHFDGVLVDAPCSGSGTWRRAPHLKWTTTPATVKAAAERQSAILHRFAALVRPGGLLIYATCSICRRENEMVVDALRLRRPEFQPVPLRHPVDGSVRSEGHFTLLPADLDSDGYFVAALRRA